MSIAEKLNYTKTHINRLKTLTGETILSSVVDDVEQKYSECEELKTENELLKDQIPTGQANGEQIHLTDSSNLPLKDIQICGNSWQETTIQGDNMIGLLDMEAKTERGLTVSISNQVLTVNGTVTSTGSIELPFQIGKEFIVGENYTGSHTKQTEKGLAFFLYNSNNQIITRTTSNGDKYTNIVPENNIPVKLTIYAEEGATFDNKQIKLMINAGEEELSWEEFSVNSPSPEFPSEIKSCKDNINFTICNKNLLKVYDGTATQNGVTITVVNGEIILNGTATGDIWFTVNPMVNTGTPTNGNKYIFKDEKYTFSAYLEGTYTICNATYVGFNLIKETNQTLLVKMNEYKTQLLSSKNNFLNNCFIRLYPGDTFNNTKVEIQLEEGEVSTAYEKHQEQNFTIPMQKPFREVEGTKDTFVKEDGKWYERHYIHEIILNGTENTLALENTKEKTIVFNYHGLSKLIKTHRIKSNLFPTNYDGTKDTEKITNLEQLIYMAIQKDKVSTLEEFKEFLKEKYDSGNPLRIYVELQIPDDLECTEEQIEVLEEIQKSKTYKNETHIYSTDEISPNFNITYKKDLETILNNITTAIIAEETQKLYKEQEEILQEELKEENYVEIEEEV